MKKISFIVGSLLMTYTGYVFSAEVDFQKEIDVARDQTSQQLKDTYTKNKEDTLKEEAKQQAQAQAANQPPKPAQPAWQQAVPGSTTPPAGVNQNTPAVTPPVTPAVPATPATPATPTTPAAPAAPASPEMPSPANIFQTPNQSDSSLPNFYR